MNETTMNVGTSSLRKKLLIVVPLVGIIPLLLATAFTYQFASDALEDAELDSLTALRNARAQHIEQYYATIKAQVQAAARDALVAEAVKDFSEGYHALPSDLGWNTEDGNGLRDREAALADARRFYLGPLRALYEQKATRTVQCESWIPDNDAVLAAQYRYITANPRSLGAKHLLDRPTEGKTAYDDVHAEFHPIFRDFKEAFGFYDIFIVDDDSDVVYTVGKEVDYGTNLESGPYSDSGLADVARRALASERADTVFVADYTPYAPSYDEPASFIAAPVFDEGEKVGAIVFQMPIDRINAIVTAQAGDHETAETYLVGADFLMRSASRFDEDSILVTRVETKAVKEALKGETGSGRNLDYRGSEVLGAWMPIEAIGMNYALIAEVDVDEALAPAAKLLRWMLILTCILAVGALLISLWAAGRMAAPVGKVTERLETLAEALLSEAQEQQAGAAEQSSAVEETRQTFQGLLTASSSMSRIGGEVLENAEIGQQSAKTIGGRIGELSTHSKQITDILTLVKEIANKSEILALNAALEGTKAGEAGRGFSLVAQQMQRLAEQVMGSVKKIESLTTDISKASGAAVLASEESEKVSRLTTSSAREIAEAVGHQQSSTEQMSVAMDEISTVAQRNVDAARNIVTSSNELLSLAENLRKSVGSKG